MQLLSHCIFSFFVSTVQLLSNSNFPVLKEILKRPNRRFPLLQGFMNFPIVWVPDATINKDREGHAKRLLMQLAIASLRLASRGSYTWVYLGLCDSFWTADWNQSVFHQSSLRQNQQLYKLKGGIPRLALYHRLPNHNNVNC